MTLGEALANEFTNTHDFSKWKPNPFKSTGYIPTKESADKHMEWLRKISKENELKRKAESDKEKH